MACVNFALMKFVEWKMNTEIWKTINGYEGKYKISNHGRVKSLKRIVKSSIRNGGHRTVPEKIMTSSFKTGYKFVLLYTGGRGKNFFVHRLVADAFIKEKPKRCIFEVMHLDGDKTNNNIYNLRYGSKLCNAAFKLDDGTMARGESHGMSKLKKEDVYKIRKLLKMGFTKKRLSEMFNVTGENIRCIEKKESWAWL